MAVVYGPDAFTVGSDQNLEAYDGNWEQISGASPLKILAADDHVSPGGTNEIEAYRWKGTGAPTGTQQIEADIKVTTSGSLSVGAFILRAPGGVETYYNLGLFSPGDAGWDAAIATMKGGSYTFQSTTTLGIVSGTTYHCIAKAVTRGSQVDLSLEVVGVGTLTWSDTAADRILSGTPGIQQYGAAGTANTQIDNVLIDNLIEDMAAQSDGAGTFAGTIHSIVDRAMQSDGVGALAATIHSIVDRAMASAGLGSLAGALEDANGVPVEVPPTGAYMAYSGAVQRQLAEWARKQEPYVEPPEPKKKRRRPAAPVYVEVPVMEDPVPPPPQIVRKTVDMRARLQGRKRGMTARAVPFYNERETEQLLLSMFAKLM